MCGIIGYIGHRNVQEVLLKGLETLEYRGYDSAGIALLGESGHIQVRKKAGRVQELMQLCETLSADEATSGGSGFGNTVSELKPSAPDAKILEGKVFH